VRDRHPGEGVDVIPVIGHPSIRSCTFDDMKACEVLHGWISHREGCV
jgi:hypothetical protein